MEEISMELKEFLPASTPLNQAVLSQLIKDINQGYYNRCRAMGINDEVIKMIETLPPNALFELMGTPVVWAKIQIDINLLQRVIQLTEQKEQHKELIDKAIKNNASNRILSECFGITSTIAAIKRKMMNIQKSKGRVTRLTDEQKKILWSEWKLFLSTEPVIDPIKRMEKLITIAEQYNLDLTSLWCEIEENNLETKADQELFEKLIILRAKIEIVTTFFNVSDRKISVARRFINGDNQNRIAFGSCDEQIKESVKKEWQYLLDKTKVKHLHQLTREHLKKLINLSDKYRIDFNTLWNALTKGLGE